MEKNMKAFHTDKENRRGVLKKMGSVSAFTIPALASFQLSEMQVHASGLPDNALDTAWNTYWSQNELFFYGTKEFWSSNKNGWFEIWQLIQK